jgi:two-component system alkaline phosphatase synthesis response regulator PhoP
MNSPPYYLAGVRRKRIALSHPRRNLATDPPLLGVYFSLLSPLCFENYGKHIRLSEFFGTFRLRARNIYLQTTDFRGRFLKPAAYNCSLSKTEYMTPRILLVGDAQNLRFALGDRLHSEGYGVEMASDGDDGFAKATTGLFDLVVLDAVLPGKTGLDVCRELRRQGHDVPIVLLTARSRTEDKIFGLKAGADDYVTKPFEMAELVARIEALVRRYRGREPASAVYRFGNIVVDRRGMEVRCGDALLDLSTKEFRLLEYLIEHRGETLSREALLREVWGYRSMPSTRTVDVHIAWLRRKLEENPRNPLWIVTVHGFGYRFNG